MRADRVLLLPPSLDQHLGFQQHVERLPGQELIPQLAVEELYAPIFLRRIGLDRERLRPNTLQPLPYSLGGGLAPFVATDVVWHARANEQVTEPLKAVSRHPRR